MITKEESLQMLKEVRANIAKLNSCKRHVFDEAPQHSFMHRHTCMNCGGKADRLAVFWYNRGIEHSKAQQDANKL